MSAATEDLLTATGSMRAGLAGTGLAGTGPSGTGPSGTGLADMVQTHRIFIQATSVEIWDALTRPGWTQQYGYRAPAQYEMRPGGAYRAFASVTMKMHGIDGVIFDGEVLEADPPRRLVQTWHVLFDPGARAEAGHPADLGDRGRLRRREPADAHSRPGGRTAYGGGAG